MLRYEDLVEEIRHRPLNERLSILETLAQSIKQDITIEPGFPNQSGARFLKTADFDSKWQPNQEEAKQNQNWLKSSQKIAEEVGQHWPQGVSSVDAINQDRRDL